MPATNCTRRRCMVAGGDVLLTLEEGLTWVCNCTKSRSDARVTAFDLSDATRIVRSHATSRRSRCDLVAISRDLVAIWSRSRGDLSDFGAICRDPRISRRSCAAAPVHPVLASDETAPTPILLWTGLVCFQPPSGVGHGGATARDPCDLVRFGGDLGAISVRSWRDLGAISRDEL